MGCRKTKAHAVSFVPQLPSSSHPRSVDSFLDLFKETCTSTGEGPALLAATLAAAAATSTTMPTRIGVTTKAGLKAEEVNPVLLALAER